MADSKKDPSMSRPYDAELSWGLQVAEAVLGRSSAFREGGGGSGQRDYESRITDRRFGRRRRRADGDMERASEVERARAFLCRWQTLGAAHRDVLAAAYAPEAVTRAQVAGRQPHDEEPVAGAFDLETWQALERSFDKLVGLALYLVEDGSDDALPRKGKAAERAGIWRTPKALNLVRLVLGDDKDALRAHKHAVRAALDGALLAWGHPPAERRRRPPRSYHAAEYIRPVRVAV